MIIFFFRTVKLELSSRTPAEGDETEAKTVCVISLGE
jgi:hypothetical protein